MWLYVNIPPIFKDYIDIYAQHKNMVAVDFQNSQQMHTFL